MVFDYLEFFNAMNFDSIGLILQTIEIGFYSCAYWNIIEDLDKISSRNGLNLFNI